MKSFFDNKKFLAGLLFIAGLAASCKKLIDIPGNPPTEITQAEQFADSTTAMAAVADVYAYPHVVGTSNFTFNDGYLSECTGLSSDELECGIASSDMEEFFSYGLTGLNSFVDDLWKDPYAGVYPVNAILTEVPASNGLSASFKKQIVAEMKVVRALYYFDLVNLFGPVPLVTSINYSVTDVLPRTSVDSIYLQIEADLTQAAQDLPATYPSAGRVRPNLYTALAFLAKVYLYQQNWQAAYNAADSVIGSGMYSLTGNLNNVFLAGSNEAIWQLPANGTYQVTQEAVNFVPGSPGTAPNFPLTPMLLNAFDSGDQRLQDWVGTVAINGDTAYYPYKYKNLTVAASTTVEDFMIFRLAEQYLIRAEAAAHLGLGSSALADVNIVRARAGLSPGAVDPSNQNAVLNAIMQERQTELFCEWGNRWFDLKRTGMADTVLASEKTGWQPNAALYPIPNSERQLNYMLYQNPGYN